MIKLNLLDLKSSDILEQVCKKVACWPKEKANRGSKG